MAGVINMTTSVSYKDTVNHIEQIENLTKAIHI
jgi:hypothetical protein